VLQSPVKADLWTCLPYQNPRWRICTLRIPLSRSFTPSALSNISALGLTCKPHTYLRSLHELCFCLLLYCLSHITEFPTMYAVTGEDVARAASWLLGWSYFTSWSLSFYPQPLRCWKNRSTRGITVDFPLLNIVGFTSYLISTTAFLFAPKIRQQYAVRHPSAPEPTVRFNDLIFALHGTIVCFVFYSQFYPRLWNFQVVKGQRASSTSLGIFYGSIIGVSITTLLVFLFRGGRDTPDSWAEIDIVRTISHTSVNTR
jgi:uncharacterized protein with PQ loop repeat